jgi:hypothetical protein
MKIENRVKNIIRFKTTIGSITLMPGINELSKEEFAAVKAHPMFEDMVKTSGLVATEEKVAKSYKTKAELKAEKEAEEKAAKELADKEAADLLGPDEDASNEEESEEETEESEESVDLNEIDLEAQTKATLIDLAESLEIETEGLSKAKLIEAINSKK